MPRPVQTSDAEEEESQRSSTARQARRVVGGPQNPQNITELENTPSDEEVEESPRSRKRARANTGGDSHQVSDEAGGSSRPGVLIRDTDG